jgi:hypothetical protein
MTRVSDAYTAAASLQTLNEEQRFDKARLRLRKRRNALFRAAQRRELEHAQQLRTRALAKRGIKKFAPKKPTKLHAHAHPHAAHHKLPLRREHVHPHHHLVERRERDQGQGRQQGESDSNQQQQGEQQEREQDRSRDEKRRQAPGVSGVRKGVDRAPMRITAATNASALTAAALKPQPNAIQALVAQHGDPAHAEDAARLAYFNACAAAWKEANQGLPSPAHPAEGFNDIQRLNVLLPLVLLHPEQRLSANIDRLKAIQSVASLSPPINKAESEGKSNVHAPTSFASKKFAERIRAAQIDLLTAYDTRGISPQTTFDHALDYLRAMSASDAK